MNLNSKYFDRIRIAPERPAAEAVPPRPCEWHGCSQLGGYRAPKGRLREGEYHNFCLDHVREYNKGYNYFAGMGDDDIVAYQRSAATGHRPTWRMGVEKKSGPAFAEFRAWEAAFSGPFGMFSGAARKPSPEQPPLRQRPVSNLAQKSFAALDLEGHETGPDIKARYKALVKLLHPDANGGDRTSEDRLRQIIQAYHYLRSVGFC
jgi:curved DNA-binding protein CbpA